MDLCSFALWKFKTIEGILEGMHSVDMDSTRYDGAMPATISYDMSNNLMTVAFDNPKTFPVTCRFSEATDTLIRLGMYKVRAENARHSNAAIPFSGKVE